MLENLLEISIGYLKIEKDIHFEQIFLSLVKRQIDPQKIARKQNQKL